MSEGADVSGTLPLQSNLLPAFFGVFAASANTRTAQSAAAVEGVPADVSALKEVRHCWGVSSQPLAFGN